MVPVESTANWNKHIKAQDKVYELGVFVGGIIGTYAQRYFGTALVIGAALGLLFGQWCKNQQKNDIEWIPRE